MRAFAAFLIILLLGAAAWASETSNYTYDARGRLVQVNRVGGANNNVATNYTYDHANNRSSKTANGTIGPPP
jgi:YD repeat-containing protein